MPTTKTNSLSFLFRQAVKTTTKAPSSFSVPAEDQIIKQLVSSRNSSFPSTKAREPKNSHARNISHPSSKIETSTAFDDSKKQVTQQISSILCGDDSTNSIHLQEANDENSSNSELKIPWMQPFSHNSLLSRKKDLSRERKGKYCFKSGQGNRIEKIVRNCADSFGAGATFDLLDRVRKETSTKEFNAFIGTYIEYARTSYDNEDALKHMEEAFKVFMIMRERGFQIKEGTYGPLLMYLIDMGLTEDFIKACELIIETSPDQLSRIGYYEMVLWIEVDNEEKIQELCHRVVTDVGDDSSLQENYLLALCERDRLNDILRLLEIIDITKVSSKDYVESIFKFFGRLQLESVAENCLLALTNSDCGAENISNLIFIYTTSVPNLAVDEVVLKFNNLHSKLECKTSSTSYEKLIAYICDLQKVHIALDVVDQMCKAGVPLSIDILHPILSASEQSYEYNLVRRINSIIVRHNLKPNTEIFRTMISLSVRAKDFSGAYKILRDVKGSGLVPTPSMYNAIIASYLREKNLKGALMVLEEMEHEDVKPDSHTYSLLLNNCDTEEDINKYHEGMKLAGVAFTKSAFMSLINAYAACGQFEKAKQVIRNNEIPVKYKNELKCVLVSSLASHGKMSDALDTYDEIKQSGGTLDPKAIISLIEHYKHEMELSRLFQLLDELDDLYNWTDGCCRIIFHCVRCKELSYATDFMKKLKDKLGDDELVLDNAFEKVFSIIAETEPTDLEAGLHLFRFIKDDLGVTPSRKSLDFLLCACVNAIDLNHALMIWQEYKANGFPYNVLSFLRMYQVTLVAGAQKKADALLREIPKDDPHVLSVIEAFQVTYLKGKKKKKGKKDFNI